MTKFADRAALGHSLEVCRQHAAALGEALDDLELRSLEASGLDAIDRTTRRLLDQFAYRYTRLQDDMGARLFPAILRALGEDIASLSFLDRLSRLEQLGWLPSADRWMELRRIRNEFTHDYPQSQDDRLLRLQLAVGAAREAVTILSAIEARA